MASAWTVSDHTVWDRDAIFITLGQNIESGSSSVARNAPLLLVYALCALRFLRSASSHASATFSPRSSTSLLRLSPHLSPCYTVLIAHRMRYAALSAAIFATAQRSAATASAARIAASSNMFGSCAHNAVWFANQTRFGWFKPCAPKYAASPLHRLCGAKIRRATYCCAALVRGASFGSLV